MEALFIVPCLTSPNINEKLIPALAKMIERNILLNNQSLFRDAIIYKYSRLNKTSRFTRMLPFMDNVDLTPLLFMSDGLLNESSSIFEMYNDILKEEDSNFGKKLEQDLQNLYKSYAEQQKRYDEEMKAGNTAGSKDAENKMNQINTMIKNHNDSIKSINPKGMIDLDNEAENMKAQADYDKTMVGIELDKAKIKQIERELEDYRQREKEYHNARSAEGKYRYDNTFTSLDAVQSPSNIKFFSQISLEPTFLEIPIEYAVSNAKDADKQMFIARVGIKCIPYVVDDVQGIIHLMREAKNMTGFFGALERKFKLALRSFNTKIWFSKARAINKGDVIDPDQARRTIKYSPTSKELTNYKHLANLFSESGSSPWQTMIMLSSFDFKDKEMADFIKGFKRMTKYVIGDLVITNETRESTYFCSVRMGNCMEIPFSYLQKVLNLNNILDYTMSSRGSKAWKREARANKVALKSNIIEQTKYSELEKKILDIIRG